MINIEQELRQGQMEDGTNFVFKGRVMWFKYSVFPT